MFRKSIVPLLILLSACTLQPWEYEMDSSGFVLPSVCRHDLALETAKIPVMLEPRGQNSKYDGFTIFEDGTPTTIIIMDDLVGWRYDDVLHHERCHVVAGPYWHL